MDSPRSGVQALILDDALLSSSSSSSSSPAAVAEMKTLLFHRLLYSNLKVGIILTNPQFAASRKEAIVDFIPEGYSIELKEADADSLSMVLMDFITGWGFSAQECLLFTSSVGESLIKEDIINQGWHIGAPESADSNELGLADHIQDVFRHIVRVNKEACPEVSIVGYTMKWSREMDFLKRGAFPLNVIDEKISFYPINLAIPLHRQMEVIDVMLHKPTDEITMISYNHSNNIEDQVKFTDAMEQLLSYLKGHPRICVIDPIERIFPLLDRALTQEILQGLPQLYGSNRRIRAPKYLKIENVDSSTLPKLFRDSQIDLPVIIKPQMACGVKDAHKMAIVFKFEGFLNLPVASPTTVQEYIDHASRIYKFYVIGDGIFYSTRKSTPNAGKLSGSDSDPNLPSIIIFDSLKSLPSKFSDDEHALNEEDDSSPVPELDMQLVHEAAGWLREKLRLTIFGFDVVVQVNTHDHVIVDVNFFPTFKDVEEKKAIPAFWDAISKANSLHKKLQSSLN